MAHYWETNHGCSPVSADKNAIVDKNAIIDKSASNISENEMFRISNLLRIYLLADSNRLDKKLMNANYMFK